ncbi:MULTISPECIES: histone-like nucleoid-structuring protein, MvaT/MvaU family [unclassified Pseudomonas]|uniref:histone-like nucleoid-structuring protein, MvaT/MvaU family n=1 Tax=unclassified Pseudomonas TaxID=196821 RepID=UPI002449F7CD|nr:MULTISPECIES: histone-like nucleoid-structuring protein, MvaT/MvaU family [unclassified Pseudomonas]MDG9928026.1 DNA binding protein [Pseudomonas sp. GD04042]MDH0482035.1 DNA binding protein [Pseudomonas sp. GD04015]MDH0604070.1 DNA binding protein [Pseudomonas sp. GD03869]
MSIIAEFKALEAKIAEQQKRLEALKGDEKLKKEIEFEAKLRALLGEYGYSLRNIVNLLDPNASKSTVAPVKGARRERTLKRYKNPNNGEVIETKGGNHKVLKAWKEQYGAEKVESWLQ